MTENTTPAVYTSLFQVLKALKVQKDGTLPGNMGGKSYFPASIVSETIKTYLVDNNLLLLTSEDQTHYEVLSGQRTQVATQVKGTYTFVSVLDGSTASISGTGDGLATGTAVSSNIASTNALKNALLRTFLISEQAVEDASHKEQDNSRPATPKNRAQAVVDKAVDYSGGAPVSAREGIRKQIESGAISKDEANARLDKIKKDSGCTAAQAQETLLAELTGGK